MHLTITVIIPTFNDWERLLKCLDALNNQTYSKENYEVLVVNNNPSSTCPYIMPAENFRIIEEAIPGSYAARNTGIMHAKGEILAFTDSDCIPDANWLTEGISAFNRNLPNNIVVAGRIKLFYRDNIRLSSAELFEKVFAFPHQNNRINVLQSMVTANVFIPRAIFKNIGLFESRFFSGGDTEFSFRLNQNRICILFIPDCIVLHPARYLLKDVIKKKKRTFGGKVYKEIYLNQRIRLTAIMLILGKQMIRLFVQLFFVWSNQVDKLRIIERLKITYTILVLFSAVLSEGCLILLRNRAKRV